MKRRLLWAVMVILFLFIASCYNTARQTFDGEYVIAGGQGTESLLTDVIETFNDKFPNTEIHYRTVDPETAAAGVADNRFVLASSLNYRAYEDMYKLKSVVIGHGGVLIIVSDSVNIIGINMYDLQNLFTGEIGNWQRLISGNIPVSIVNRPTTTDIGAFFVGKVMEEGFEGVSFVEEFEDPIAALGKIDQTLGAVGFCSSAYQNQIGKRTHTAILEGVEAKGEAIKDKTYPLSFELQILYHGRLDGIKRQFILFLNSAEGQSMVKENNFIPLY